MQCLEWQIPIDEEKLCKALLQYHDTPSARDGLSPAQKLFGRPMQDTILAHYKSFNPAWQHKAVEKVEHTQQEAANYYNRMSHPLPEIQEGSQIALQDPRTKLWDVYGVVIRVGQHRQYVIKTESGQVLTRNCKFLCQHMSLLVQPTSRVT